MLTWELSTETNRIETAVVRYGVASIFATVIFGCTPDAPGLVYQPTAAASDVPLMIGPLPTKYVLDSYFKTWEE